MTLEGCVVKFADTIAYIGRDLQDAREIGLIPDDDTIPERCRDVLGESNREIINTLIFDLLENSDTEDSGFISYSSRVEEALIALRSFSRKHIYDNPVLISEREKIRTMFAILFGACIEDLAEERRKAWIYTDFIDSGDVSPAYLESATPRNSSGILSQV